MWDSRERRPGRSGSGSRELDWCKGYTERRENGDTGNRVPYARLSETEGGWCWKGENLTGFEYPVLLLYLSSVTAGGAAAHQRFQRISELAVAT